MGHERTEIQSHANSASKRNKCLFRKSRGLTSKLNCHELGRFKKTATRGAGGLLESKGGKAKGFRSGAAENLATVFFHWPKETGNHHTHSPFLKRGVRVLLNE